MRFAMIAATITLVVGLHLPAESQISPCRSIMFDGRDLVGCVKELRDQMELAGQLIQAMCLQLIEHHTAHIRLAGEIRELRRALNLSNLPPEKPQRFGQECQGAYLIGR